MNRIILKHGRPLAAAILAVFVWVLYRRIASGGQILPLVSAAVIVWGFGTPAFIYLWPRITVNGYKKALVKRGFGTGPIPINTLYAVPDTSSPPASPGSLMATGADDLLYVGGWLDLSKGPQVLHVPDMAGRYFSVQFTDPATSANVAYVGTRATGPKAGDYLLSGPGWTGTVPNGMAQISLPTDSALVIGRVFVANDTDLPVAYALAKQIGLSPLKR